MALVFVDAEELLQIIQDRLDAIEAGLTRLEVAVNEHETWIGEHDDLPIPDPDPDPDPEPEPDPDPLPAPSEGIWISPEEIKNLPDEGVAWKQVLDAANSSWGTANLADNNSQHDVKTLAGAYVAVRNNDTAMRNKVIAGLQSAMKSGLNRSLELSRGFQTYVIAADVIGYRTPEFEKWVADMVMAKIPDHSAPGDSGVYGTALYSATNWGGHARASMAAAAVYLDHAVWKQEVVDAQKEMLGLPVPNPKFNYDNTNWHADSSNKAGINRKGSTISGVNVSGVLVEDWRRGDEFKWPPTKSGYQWEGQQGLVVTAVILHRAGLLPFNAGDNAIVRSFNMLYGRGEAANNDPVFVFEAEGDDNWLPWVVNYYGGTDFPTVSPTQAGKNMGYTDWTHA